VMRETELATPPTEWFKRLPAPRAMPCISSSGARSSTLLSSPSTGSLTKSCIPCSARRSRLAFVLQCFVLASVKKTCDSDIDIHRDMTGYRRSRSACRFRFVVANRGRQQTRKRGVMHKATPACGKHVRETAPRPCTPAPK